MQCSMLRTMPELAFFFMPPQFMDGDGDPVPILKDYSPSRLVEDFQVISQQTNVEKRAFNPVAIVIVQQSRTAEQYFTAWAKERG